MARAQLALGRMDEAERWAERARESAESMGLAGRLGWSRYARAIVDLARGEAATAAVAARDGVALSAEAGDAVGAARSRIVHGQALAALGDTGAAETELELARGELVAAGASRYADEAARELRGLGRRVARPGARASTAAEGIAALSVREREIAELVAAGRTNKEIAAELFLAPKTVEHHLSRVFAKLGVRGRAAVAGAISREAGRVDA
jgi:DNA-binding CsgD family transcriptional regulator